MTKKTTKRDKLWLLASIPIAPTLYHWFRGWYYIVAIVLAAVALAAVSVMIDHTYDHIKERRR